MGISRVLLLQVKVAVCADSNLEYLISLGEILTVKLQGKSQWKNPVHVAKIAFQNGFKFSKAHKQPITGSGLSKVSLMKLAILARLLVHAMGCLKGCAPPPNILMCLSPNFHSLRMWLYL